MKSILYFLFLVFSVSALHGQVENPNFDADLARKYGADEHGMKKYILVMLRTGASTTSDKDFISACFASHMANMDQLVKDNKLIVAGPLRKNDKGLRGIFILDVADAEQASRLLQADDAVREGLLAADYFEWFGSAALPAYLETSEKIWKKQH